MAYLKRPSALSALHSRTERFADAARNSNTPLLTQSPFYSEAQMATPSQSPSSKLSVSPSAYLSTGHSTTEFEPLPLDCFNDESFFAEHMYLANSAYLTAVPSIQTPIHLTVQKPLSDIHIHHYSPAISSQRRMPHLSEDHDPVTELMGTVSPLKISAQKSEESTWNVEDVETWVWPGYVRHPESSERSSLRREAETMRMERGKKATKR
jgi:hypothetical protein